MEINKDIINKYPWTVGQWEGRNKMISAEIPRGAPVLDLGGGIGTLKKHLSLQSKYQIIDIEPWVHGAIVADFNKNEYPPAGEDNFIVAQGLLEYIKEPALFLMSIRQYGGSLIMTYTFLPEGQEAPIHRENYLRKDQVRDLLNGTGWRVVNTKDITPRQKMFFCVKI